MYRKGKSHEINDIIDSAHASADYSHTNKYRDEVYDNKQNLKNDNTTNTNTSMNTFTNNRFRQNNDIKLNNGNSDNTPTPTGNIFLKTSSQTNVFSSNNVSTKNEPCKESTLSLDNDNFPSLGSSNKNINLTNAAKPLDFKKVIQTKSAIVQTAAAAVTPSVHKSFHSSNKLAMYQDIKDKSEKYAKVKMNNEYSSDDDAY
jgi:hypothetical protein